MTNLNLDLILFDLIGTTIKDSKNGKSLILDCFQEAFFSSGLKIGLDRINRERGKTKKEAIINILQEENAELGLTDNIYKSFINLLNQNVDSFTAIEGTSIVFNHLKDKGVKIGLGTGLPLDFMYQLLDQVGWQVDFFDYVNSADEMGAGRPSPIMIFAAMEKLGLKDKSKILKIGDTVVDIQEGKNAGVLTAGVLTGTQKRTDLEVYKPNFILESVAELQF